MLLRREGRIVANKSVLPLRTDDDHGADFFQFTPDQTGRFVYAVEDPCVPGRSDRREQVRARLCSR